MLIIIIIRQ